MKRVRFFLLLFGFWVLSAASAQETTSAQDPNVSSSAITHRATMRRTLGAEAMGWVVAQVMAQQESTDPTLCAVVVLPGPAESFDIRFGVFNVIDDRLDVLILNSFRALGGQSLLHQSVFDTAPPASGTLTVEYPPDAVGKGPVLLSFTSFTQFNSVAFNTDPDTYDDPNFGATLQDLDQTVIELVYASDVPDSRRCQGTLRFDAALNASIANVVQVFP